MGVVVVDDADAVRRTNRSTSAGRRMEVDAGEWVEMRCAMRESGMRRFRSEVSAILLLLYQVGG
jgi:hypothetical protein